MQRRFPKLMVLALLTLPLVAICWIWLNASLASTVQAAKLPVRTGTSDGQQTSSASPNQLGVPAIQPHSISGPVPATSSEVGRATITPQDITNYISRYGMPHAVGNTRRSTVTKIQLLSSEMVGRLLGESTGLADAAPVYFVELEGNFSFLGPNGIVAIYHRGYMVFDANSGYLVMWGGRP